MSFPQAVGQCPIYYNHYNTGRPYKKNMRYVSRYQDIPAESYYPFGFGLSYSKFVYSDIKLSNKILDKHSQIVVNVKVKNVSDVVGEEVIQLYIQDLVGSVVRPVKELKAFKKVKILPKEEIGMKFEIYEEMLKFWNESMKFEAEVGEFKVFVGGRSNEENLLSDTFTLK